MHLAMVMDVWLDMSGAVVSAMLHDPRVRTLSFTGSTEVGRVLHDDDAPGLGERNAREQRRRHAEERRHDDDRDLGEPA